MAEPEAVSVLRPSTLFNSKVFYAGVTTAALTYFRHGSGGCTQRLQRKETRRQAFARGIEPVTSRFSAGGAIHCATERTLSGTLTASHLYTP